MNQSLKTFAKSGNDHILTSILKTSVSGFSSAAVAQALDFKSDIPDIVTHGILGLLESNSLGGAMYSASKRAAYKNL